MNSEDRNCSDLRNKDRFTEQVLHSLIRHKPQYVITSIRISFLFKLHGYKKMIIFMLKN